MKTHKIYTFLWLCILLASISCAHRTGHRNKESDSRRSSRSSVSSNKRERMEGSEVFRKYNSAVFMVFTSNDQNAYQGSGFFIGEDGLAVSNYHVFKGTNIGDEAIKMYGDDQAYKVSEVYFKSAKEDFILFRVECDNQNWLPIASSRPQVGDKVFAIGSPMGLENTFSSGEISQWRSVNLMQTNAQIDHGSSGGALINEYGEAVGITSGTLAAGSQANLNYAWSIDVVKPHLP